MHTISRTLLAATAALLAGACVQGTNQATNGHGDVPEAVVVGEPVECIQTNFIRNTRVHDDYTIDFEMTGGKTYRNTLPNRCPGLGFDEAFAYRTTVSQLCRIDMITVLQRGSSIRGPGCGLGKFVPVELVKDSAG
ncbi:hypothetical protein GRI89_05970 [Altererythrobacter salegens]|uniref:Lipoprotein n=1 Tax=Croceibacterium salegens TaxID=1737568 RepID=A0A6I4ST69_9SPHN|nr:hypothetical protein [Croceibacterium salegens]MXO59085.1 hypothetical protein [Croceibacterium salegens]